MIEIACQYRARLGECPIWDEQNSYLYWLDIVSGTVHQLNTKNRTHRLFSIGQTPGSLVLCDNGYVMIASKNGPTVFDFESNRIIDQYIFNKTAGTNIRFNDGKCDQNGEFWVGAMACDEEIGAGSLYSMDSNFEFQERIGKLTIPNGMAWNNCGDKFYFIDTVTRSVVEYGYDPLTDQLLSGETIITITQDEGVPDGMTIDCDGMIWIAHWDGWQVSRWNPETGSQLLSIKLPVGRVTSCTFGGEDYSDLYITTAFDRLTEAELNEQPMAGALFVFKNCGYRGLPPARFRLK